MAFAAGAAGAQQPSAGEQIFKSACGSCHSLDVVTEFHLGSRSEYADMVSAMIGAGAVVTKQEEPILVDYLWERLGKKDTAKPDPAVKALVDQACTSCHNLDGMKNHVYEKPDDYKSLVQSMISNGATIPADQVPIIVDYLFKVYGKK
jgi:mono/diheme cytochrome c family protein